MPPPLSEDFRDSALVERDKLIALYRECRTRHEQHLEQANEAALEAERYLRAVRELGELLGLEEQLSLVELTVELRGQRLREVAAGIVFRTFQPGERFHYKEWFELLVSEGHRIGGKNPAATFLTQVARIDGVQRVGRRTGLYEVTPVASVL